MKNNYNIYIKELYNQPELYIEEFIDYKDDIYFWPKIIRKFNPKNILEVGIGNGRLINILHNKVEEYDGVDFSDKIINYCKKNYNFNNVNLYNSNFKDFKNNKKYDLIIFPFNVFNNFYNEFDFKMFFSTLNKITNKDSVIIIDTFNPTSNDFIDSIRYKKTNQFKMNDKIIDVYEKKKFDIINSTCIYYKRYNIGKKIIKESILPNRLFLHQELLMLLDLFGYDIINIYGDYNFEDYKKNSRKQIVVFRRK